MTLNECSKACFEKQLKRLMERDFGTWSGKKKIEMFDHLTKSQYEYK